MNTQPFLMQCVLGSAISILQITVPRAATFVWFGFSFHILCQNCTWRRHGFAHICQIFITLATHFHKHIQRHTHKSTHVQSAHKRNGDNQAQEPGWEGQKKSFVRHLAHTHKTNKQAKKCQKKPDIRESQEKIRTHKASSKAIRLFLTQHQSNSSIVSFWFFLQCWHHHRAPCVGGRLFDLIMFTYWWVLMWCRHARSIFSLTFRWSTSWLPIFRICILKVKFCEPILDC